MAQRDRYDNDVLKALQRIANSLSYIERYFRSKNKDKDKEVNDDGRV